MYGKKIDIVMMGLGEMMTDEEIAEFIKTADLDNDGQINYRGKSQSITGETLWTINIWKPETDICSVGTILIV